MTLTRNEVRYCTTLLEIIAFENSDDLDALYRTVTGERERWMGRRRDVINAILEESESVYWLLWRQKVKKAYLQQFLSRYPRRVDLYNLNRKNKNELVRMTLQLIQTTSAQTEMIGPSANRYEDYQRQLDDGIIQGTISEKLSISEYDYMFSMRKQLTREYAIHHKE